MKQTDIIHSAILTEKAHSQMAQNVYSFKVAERAGKKEIANAVEKQFSVNVEKVNVLSLAAKSKRVGKTKKTVLVGGGKKAVVWLKAGQTISMLSPQSGKKKDATKKDKKEK